MPGANGNAIVAWRSVYAPDASDLLIFSGRDYILYSIYKNGGATWSTPQVLYNGTAGAVKGISAPTTDEEASTVAAVAYGS